MKIKIVSDGSKNYRNTQVFLDGEKVECVQFIKFEHDVKGWPKLTITFLNPDLELETEFEKEEIKQ